MDRDSELETRRKRLLYRSVYRGNKENDILLGQFAQVLVIGLQGRLVVGDLLLRAAVLADTLHHVLELGAFLGQAGELAIVRHRGRVAQLALQLGVVFLDSFDFIQHRRIQRRRDRGVRAARTQVRRLSEPPPQRCPKRGAVTRRPLCLVYSVYSVHLVYSASSRTCD